jgi:preprotein translocase subunit Sec61beta
VDFIKRIRLTPKQAVIIAAVLIPLLVVLASASMYLWFAERGMP